MVELRVLLIYLSVLLLDGLLLVVDLSLSSLLLLTNVQQIDVNGILDPLVKGEPVRVGVFQVTLLPCSLFILN